MLVQVPEVEKIIDECPKGEAPSIEVSVNKTDTLLCSGENKSFLDVDRKAILMSRDALKSHCDSSGNLYRVRISDSLNPDAGEPCDRWILV